MPTLRRWSNAIRKGRARSEVRFLRGHWPYSSRRRRTDCSPPTIWAIMCLLELAGAAARFWRGFSTAEAAAIERKPQATILVDWPRLHLKLRGRCLVAV